MTLADELLYLRRRVEFVQRELNLCYTRLAEVERTLLAFDEAPVPGLPPRVGQVLLQEAINGGTTVEYILGPDKSRLVYEARCLAAYRIHYLSPLYTQMKIAEWFGNRHYSSIGAAIKRGRTLYNTRRIKEINENLREEVFAGGEESI